jgi:LPS sulfotransferase NodH
MREDILAQATSRYVAAKTGYFHSVNKEREWTRSMEVPFDFDALWHHVDHIVEMQGAWARFFATEGVTPLRLTYEALEADPEAVLRAVSTFIEIPLPAPVALVSIYEKVRDGRHARIRELALDEARRRRLASLRDAVFGA